MILFVRYAILSLHCSWKSWDIRLCFALVTCLVIGYTNGLYYGLAMGIYCGLRFNLSMGVKWWLLIWLCHGCKMVVSILSAITLVMKWFMFCLAICRMHNLATGLKMASVLNALWWQWFMLSWLSAECTTLPWG